MGKHSPFSKSDLVELFSAQKSLTTEKQWRNVEASRLYFLEHGAPKKDSVVREEVFASWERCKHAELDPASTLLRLKVADEEYQRVYGVYEHMLGLIIPKVTMAEDIGFRDDYVVEIMSENGISLFQDGNRELHTYVSGKSIFNESTMGTNAHSLCVRYRRPFMLVGPEHYCSALLNLAALAVPITDEHTDTRASLVFTRPLPEKPWSSENQKLLLHAMGLLTSIATSVETELRFDQYHTHMVELEQEVEKLKPKGRTAFKPVDGALPVDADSHHSLERKTKGDSKKASSPLGNKKGAQHSDDQQIAVGDVASITFSDIMGQSPSTRCAVELAKRFARTNENILILGESGTGKEYFAQAIHNGSRPNEPFMSINCAAIPPRLIESELFGYESGTFTGAQRGGKAGKIELADGGTLFLDEIGDMPLELQATLLRFLENKRVMRLGGKVYKQVDCRVIAATNRDLFEMAREGRFREDLYYRLSTLNIELEPLRKRPEDLDFFIRYYLDEFMVKSGKRRSFSSEASALLHSYAWPGNIRQLKNATLSSCYAAQNDVIEVADLPPYIIMDTSLKENNDNNNLSLRHLEEDAIKTALARTDYIVAKAADILGISRATLYRKLKEYNLASNIYDFESPIKS